MQTGYFAKIKSHADRRNIVSIAISNPKWLYVAHNYQPLQPSYNLLRSFRANKITEQQYVQQYVAQLDKLNPQQVLDDLLSFTPTPILCCHCSTQHFCHRHIFADWLYSKLNVKLSEYRVGNVTRLSGRIVPSDPSEQLNLNL